MSDKLTRITYYKDGNIHHGNGWMDWGEIPVADIIKGYRQRMQRQLEQAQEALSKRDDEFQIDVVRGSIMEKHIKTLQEAKKA